jgi:ribulose bisphosphate carboxylase small subunit
MGPTETIEGIRLEQAAWCEGWRRSPLWLRLIGGPKTYYADRGSYRLRWGELGVGRCGIAVSVGGYETAHLHLAIGVGQVFIRLPFLDKAICGGRNSIESPRYGFSLHSTDVHLNWGQRCKIINFPWRRRYIFNEYLDANGEWRPRLWREDGAEAPRWTAEYPYHYMLDNGEVQHVTATVTRERHWPVWKWFGESTHMAALGRVKKPRRAWVSDYLRGVQKRLRRPVETIDIRFSDEVGSRAGSWKGGTVGCSYEMKPGETPQHTLMRMQRERRFR